LSFWRIERFIVDHFASSPDYAGSLDSNERTRLLEEVDSTNVVYSRQHLLFLRETTLMAQRFDADRPRVAPTCGFSISGRDGLPSRFTFEPAQNSPYPIWSADGRDVIFRSSRDRPSDLYRSPRAAPAAKVVVETGDAEISLRMVSAHRDC
jgi:hypothetical protein